MCMYWYTRVCMCLVVCISVYVCACRPQNRLSGAVPQYLYFSFFSQTMSFPGLDSPSKLSWLTGQPQDLLVSSVLGWVRESSSESHVCKASTLMTEHLPSPRVLLSVPALLCVSLPSPAWRVLTGKEH